MFWVNIIIFNIIINIIVINKNTYFELKSDSTSTSENTHVIHKQGFNRFKIELKTDENIRNNYRNTYFQIVNIEKPLLSVSSYKLGELQEFCKKLQLNTDLGLKKKQDLYNLLDGHLNKIE